MAAAQQQPKATLYVFNLNDKATLNDIKINLYMLFTQHGRVYNVAIRNREMRGQAFIVYDNARDATAAMQKEQGRDFMGKQLKIEYAKIESTFIPRSLLGIVPEKTLSYRAKAPLPDEKLLPPPPGSDGKPLPAPPGRSPVPAAQSSAPTNAPAPPLPVASLVAPAPQATPAVAGKKRHREESEDEEAEAKKLNTEDKVPEAEKADAKDEEEDEESGAEMEMDDDDD